MCAYSYREPLYTHVTLLACDRNRLKVRDLPTFDSDEDRWLADNRNRHEAIAALLAGDLLRTRDRAVGHSASGKRPAPS